MRTRVPRTVYALLFLYIAISLGYQIVATVSMTIGYLDLRHQVQDPHLAIDAYSPVISSVTDVQRRLGLAVGDRVETLNGAPYTGRAQFQADRWYAHPGETLRIGVTKPDGRRATVAIPLTGFHDPFHLGQTILIFGLILVIPLVCLLAGYWVALARPTDINAWLVLIILSFPQVFLSVSTFNWLPGPWLFLRLYWHLELQILAAAALLWFGLLFPERSRIDIRLPWFKWLVAAIVFAGGIDGLASDYAEWYHVGLVPYERQFDAVTDATINWLIVVCIAIYGVAIFDKLRHASTPDVRRRLRVLCAGSTVGLGSALFVWGVLPKFGVAVARIEWLEYLSAAFMLAFPFSLAYVILVQRAMDVNILVRMGTRYILARTTVLIVQFAVILLLLFYVVIPLLQRHDQSVLTIALPVLALVLLLRLHFVKRSMGDRVRDRLDRRFFREAYNTEHVLSELAVQARSISDPATLIQTISGRISEVLHVQQMAVLLRNGSVFELQTAGGPALSGALILAEHSTPVQHLVRTNSPAVLYRDQPDIWFTDAGGDEQQALNHLNAEVLLPLVGRNKLMGVMVLGPKRSEEPYSPSDLQLLASVGAQAGLGLEVNELAQSLAEEAARHQRVQREVEIAREVQQRLFPQIPSVPGMDIAGHCRPALGVGGDYYDVIPLDDGRLAIAIGDISGKGIAAALLMASLRASLRGILDAGSQDMARMVRKLNRLIHESSTSNRYATFFLAIYDPATRELRYVNAGHNPPLVVRGAETHHLEACGPVVGLLKDIECEERCLALEPGDTFIGYTDGISEAMTLHDEEWGEERMQAAVEAVCDRSSQEILDVVFRAADVFTAGAPQHDDMTLLIFRLLIAI
jgi:phosphoserine phosphatase RsbU/P